MAQYDRQVALAQKLIKKYGQAVQWMQEVPSIPDVNKPWESAPGSAPVQYPVFIVFLSPKNGLFAELGFLKGADIPVGGNRGLMASVDAFSPSVIDKVIRDGEALAIKSIDILHPGGQVILYTIEFVS